MPPPKSAQTPSAISTLLLLSRVWPDDFPCVLLIDTTRTGLLFTCGFTVSFDATNFSLSCGLEVLPSSLTTRGKSRRMTGSVDWYWAWPSVSFLFTESFKDAAARVSDDARALVES